MPVNREPHIYPGYVISQISKNAGEQEVMPYHVAQSCVSSGTHRWPDDETDLPNHVQAMITERVQTQAEIDAANAEHNAKLRAEREAAEAEAQALASARAGKPIVFIVVDGKTYLARPFPSTAIFEKDTPQTDGVISVTAENALADYKIVDDQGEVIVAELLSEQLPDVDIPDDWRDKAPLQLTAMAKKIRATKEPMKADEARAILEEWTRKDDPVSVDAPAGEGKEIPDTENRNKSDVVVDAEGKPLLSPEERAQEAAKQFVQNDDF